MSDELVYQVALELIPGVGDKGIKQLISYCGSASKVFKTPKSKLLKIPGVGEKMAMTVLNSTTTSEAEKIISETKKAGANALHYTNKNYPELLKQLPDAPNLLFTKGYGNLNPERSIAVVGTRKATEYGKRTTEKLIAQLAGLDVTVVSGLAYGIDICAHKACLKNDVPTIAVLAGGIDRIYPSVHKKYAQEMQETGALVTESIPGTKPERHLFPARNRIIAGMTDATIVVEAAEKGGALITANIADSYNRAVFAVPGNIGNSYSEGCNKLIASQKALIYSSIEELIFQLGWDEKAVNQKQLPLPDLSEDEEKLYKLLKDSESPLEIDMIALKSQLSINKVASVLLGLEFKNLVKNMPGKKFGLV